MVRLTNEPRSDRCVGMKTDGGERSKGMPILANIVRMVEHDV